MRILLGVGLLLSACSHNAQVPQRRISSYLGTTCTSADGALTYSIEAGSERKTLTLRGRFGASTHEFVYVSEERPMGSVPVTTWIAKDGSYLQDRGLTGASGRFAQFFDATTGRQATSIVKCDERTDGRPDEE